MNPAKENILLRREIGALRALLERMKIEHCYSAYYLPCRWRNVGLVCRVDEARRANAPLYGKLDWAGYYLLLGKMKRD